MKKPEIVEEILQMAKLGYGKKKIARLLAISVNMVRSYAVGGIQKSFY